MASTDALSPEFLENLDSLEFEWVPKRGNTPRSFNRQAVERRVRRKLQKKGLQLKKTLGFGCGIPEYQVVATVRHYAYLADLAREWGVIKEGQAITDD